MEGDKDFVEMMLLAGVIGLARPSINDIVLRLLLMEAGKVQYIHDDGYRTSRAGRRRFSSHVFMECTRPRVAAVSGTIVVFAIQPPQ